MATRIDDRWLWLGLGVAAFFAIKGVQYALADIVRLTEIDSYQYEPKRKKDDHPEDTLTVEDLKVLADSPYTNISNAAISLALSRYSRIPQSKQTVTHDLDSFDPVKRQRATTLIHYFRNRDNLPWDTSGGLPLDPDGYESTTRSSDSFEPSEEGGESPLARIRDELIGDGEILPSIENPVAGWENVPRERAVNGSADADDVETRRRRREVMVLHEGEGAVTGSNIIRPSGPG